MVTDHRHYSGGPGYVPGCPGCKALKRVVSNRHLAKVRGTEAHAAAQRRSQWWQQGIDVAAAEALFAVSDGTCPLCGRTPARRLHVDHDHATGKVRGLLCGPCNQAIGLMADDPARLRAAAEYLEKHA